MLAGKPPGAHLAKTALAEHHQEVEVSQLHAILVAVGVEPGRSVGRLAVGVLAWADLCSLDGEEETGDCVMVTTLKLLPTQARTHE